METGLVQGSCEPRHFQSLYTSRGWAKASLSFKASCLRAISRSGCQRFCFWTTEQPANGAEVGSEKSTLDMDSDSNMTSSGRRDANELSLPNLEDKKESKGVMSACAWKTTWE